MVVIYTNINTISLTLVVKMAYMPTPHCWFSSSPGCPWDFSTMDPQANVAIPMATDTQRSNSSRLKDHCLIRSCEGIFLWSWNIPAIRLGGCEQHSEWLRPKPQILFPFPQPKHHPYPVSKKSAAEQASLCIIAGLAVSGWFEAWGAPNVETAVKVAGAPPMVAHA